jgi:hypothetical protein
MKKSFLPSFLPSFLLVFLLSKNMFSQQVWTGSTTSTQTNDNVHLGGPTLKESFLNINTGGWFNVQNLNNSTCTRGGQSALNIEWSLPNLPTWCDKSSTTGEFPDIMNVSLIQTNTLIGGISTGPFSIPIFKLSESKFSLFGENEFGFSNTIHRNIALKGNVQFQSKVRIGSIMDPYFSPINFPYNFSVDNGDSRFLGKVQIGNPKNEFANYALSVDGEVGCNKMQIGNLKASGNFSNYALSIDGNVVCKKMIVETTDWADYVFSKDYRLKPLQEVEKYILTHHHLPEMPNQSEINALGLDVSAMQKMQQMKIEELTLYIIKQQELLNELSKKVQAIEAVTK